MLRASVVIDYQNVHLTAYDVFNGGGDRHESLIHPMRFAKRAIAQRNSTQRDGFPHAEVARVTVFRGLHHVDHDWEQHRRCIDQAAIWRADGVDVQLRDLKYSYELGADGRPILCPAGGRRRRVSTCCAHSPVCEKRLATTSTSSS